MNYFVLVYSFVYFFAESLPHSLRLIFYRIDFVEFSHKEIHFIMNTHMYQEVTRVTSPMSQQLVRIFSYSVKIQCHFDKNDVDYTHLDSRIS